MNLSELRTFLAIVEAGSLVKASSTLNVTQSTVTTRLKSLEATLGQQLLHRSKSGVSLTAAGERLRRYAGTIADLWRQAQAELSMPGTLSGVCNFACESDLWPELGAQLFARLTHHNTDGAISVWTGSASEVAQWLHDGRADLAISSRGLASPRHRQIELEPDRLILVSTGSDSLGRSDPGYVFVEAGEEFGRTHAATYADAPAARLSFGNAQLGFEHLMTTGGTAYLPERLVQKALADGELIMVADTPAFERALCLGYETSAATDWPWFDDVLADIGLRREGAAP